MCQIAASGWFGRLALSVAVVFAFLIGLDRPLEATLIVSFLSGNVFLFDDNGRPSRTFRAGAAGRAVLVASVGVSLRSYWPTTRRISASTTITRPLQIFRPWVASR